MQTGNRNFAVTNSYSLHVTINLTKLIDPKEYLLHVNTATLDSINKQQEIKKEFLKEIVPICLAVDELFS